MIMGSVQSLKGLLPVYMEPYSKELTFFVFETRILLFDYKYAPVHIGYMYTYFARSNQGTMLKVTYVTHSVLLLWLL